MSTGGVRALLGVAPFRRLLATRLVGQAADGVFQVSLAGAVMFNPQSQPDPVDVATGFAVLLLPYSLVGPFAGVLIDRWDRRSVLVRANLVRAPLAALVAVLLLAVGPTSPALYAGALVVLSVNRFILSALSAALPHTVAAGRLVLANSVSTTGGGVVTAIGGAAALGVRGVLGASTATYAGIAVLSGLAYLAASWTARLNAVRSLGPDTLVAGRSALLAQVADVASALAAGARHVRRTRPAFAALLAISAYRLCYGVNLIATLLLYRYYFSGGEFLRAGLVGLAQIFAATTLGSLTGAVLTPVVTRRLSPFSWIVVMLASAAVVQLVLGLPFRLAAMVPGAFLLGLIAQSAKICVDTTVQLTIDDVHQGWVFSFYDTLFNLTFVAAAILGALFLPADGHSPGTVWLVAAGYAATAVAYAVGGRTAAPTPAPLPAVTPSVGAR